MSSGVFPILLLLLTIESVGLAFYCLSFSIQQICRLIYCLFCRFDKCLIRINDFGLIFIPAKKKIFH